MDNSEPTEMVADNKAGDSQFIILGSFIGEMAAWTCVAICVETVCILV